jgi:hypothetical protein
VEAKTESNTVNHIELLSISCSSIIALRQYHMIFFYEPIIGLVTMEYVSKLCILFLSLATLAVISDVYAETTLSEQLVRCAAIGDNEKRLTCYDKLVRNNSFYVSQPQGQKFIQPPATFLDSHLVAEPWKVEYTLTVRSFVDLISHAVMEDKKRVTVQGWSRDKRDYILHITMQTPVKLHFLPRKSAKGDMSMSLLRDVKMKGYTLGADQFIMTIATMVPDK